MTKSNDGLRRHGPHQWRFDDVRLAGYARPESTPAIDKPRPQLFQRRARTTARGLLPLRRRVRIPPRRPRRGFLSATDRLPLEGRDDARNVILRQVLPNFAVSGLGVL
mmetsp:Transcript_117318/g.326208  ORF Transcript_117318/g.326208 Transcript_117318/m.326208 type:complete len:108 (+) Transcript_117318:236-559(+)